VWGVRCGVLDFRRIKFMVDVFGSREKGSRGRGVQYIQYRDPGGCDGGYS
jgi:hypothetical protein